jgi:hypothetical protein
MDGFHKGANDRRDGFAVRLKDAKTDGSSDGILVARGIAAAVKIEADGRRFFLEGQAGPGLAEYDEWNGAVDARAASAFQA